MIQFKKQLMNWQMFPLKQKKEVKSEHGRFEGGEG